MDGFHLPGDPYFPDGWNDGWNDDELEPIPEVVVPAAEPEHNLGTKLKLRIHLPNS